MRPAVVSIVLTWTLMCPAAAAATSPGRGAPAVALRVPLLPLTWVVAHMRDLVGHGAPVENACVLRREQGWIVLELSVHEPARALYLEVAGRVQFDSAEIIFRDGDARPLDLRGVVRGGGLFALHEVAGGREVSVVRLNLRATTERAAVGLRIARFGAAPGDD